MSGGNHHWVFDAMSLARQHTRDLQDRWHHASDTIKNVVTRMLELEPDLVVDRVIINGQTQGMHSGVHRDNLDPRSRTLLLYLNPQWNPEWQGYTVFFGEDRQEIQRILPEPGKMLVYDGSMLHQGQGPDMPGILRVTLSVQMSPLNTGS